MTTNVFDGNSGLIATDSRWSVQYGRWLIYIDDTNFDKIEVCKTTAFMFAGKGRLIQQWKNWIRSDPVDESGMPSVDGIVVSGIDIPSKQARFSEGFSIKKGDAIFAGSGARHACLCWESNKNALKSIETAKMLDPATGGVVKYWDSDTGNNNLGGVVFAPTTIDEVDMALNLRGVFMDIRAQQSSGVPFRLSDIAASDVGAGELLEIQEKIKSGELSAEAPCDAMYNEWSAESKSRLTEFLGEVFGWQKKHA